MNKKSFMRATKYKMASEILYEKKGARAIITLNRPGVLNAINDTLPRNLAQAVAKAESDDDVRVLLLQGAGKGFCGGYDLKEYAETPGLALVCCVFGVANESRSQPGLAGFDRWSVGPDERLCKHEQKHT
jgi:enoyl-CoA hydratase/carnithine racemase